jgi:hypothetical protein
MKRIKIQYLALSIIFLSSCEKFVDAGPPQDILVSSTVFKNNETATSAMTAIYATMMRTDYPLSYNIPLMTGLYGDELVSSQTTPEILTLYKNSLISKDALTNQLWTNAFNYIFQSNAVIESLERSSSISINVNNQLKGEALFIRSFWNYYLSNLYGAIPLITSTDYAANTKLTRSSVEFIHAQIVKDLIWAKDLLTEKYVAGNSIAESADRIRPNTFVVSALLSRVYLDMKNYSKAEEEASRVIASSKYTLADLSLVFKRVSKEAIWQLELPTNTTGYSNSFEATMFTLTSKPSSVGSQRCATISPNLLNIFDIKDKRRTTWIGTYNDNTANPAATYYFSRKFRTLTTPADEYTTPFRLAEMYLIRAEVRARLGLVAEAIIDADKIRNRAGLNLLKDITPNIGKEALLDSIMKEKRRELFCEWSIRWFDIRRSEKVDKIMTEIAIKKESEWKSTAIYWPVPLNDVLNSVNQIKQNEGYN